MCGSSPRVTAYNVLGWRWTAECIASLLSDQTDIRGDTVGWDNDAVDGDRYHLKFHSGHWSKEPLTYTASPGVYLKDPQRSNH